jgi:hypothetical protein
MSFDQPGPGEEFRITHLPNGGYTRTVTRFLPDGGGHTRTVSTFLPNGRGGHTIALVEAYRN